MAYFSSQATIEARISALRLNNFIDRDADGSPDTDALTAGLKEARGLIRGYIKQHYDADTIDAWDIDAGTVPDLIGAISDRLCIRLYYVSNPRFQESAKLQYDEAIALLKDIRKGDLDVYEAERYTPTDLMVVERVPSDFDPERDIDDMTVNPYWTLPDTRELDGY